MSLTVLPLSSMSDQIRPAIEANSRIFERPARSDRFSRRFPASTHVAECQRPRPARQEVAGGSPMPGLVFPTEREPTRIADLYF